MEANAGVCFLGELPDELLLDIASQLRVERGYLVDKEDEDRRRRDNTIIVRSLYALTLSCQKFNALATPLLYQCIIAAERPQDMPLLLRTLFGKPELAQYIQYVEFTTFDCSSCFAGLPCPRADVDKYLDCMAATTWLDPLPATTLDILGKGNNTAWRIQNSVAACSKVYASLHSAMQCMWTFRYDSAFAVLLSFVDNVQDVAVPYSVNALSMMAFREWNRPGVFRRLWLKDPRTSAEQHSISTIISKPMLQNGHLAHYIRSLILSESMCLEFEPPAAMKLLSLTVHDASSDSLDQYLRGCDSLESFSLRWQWTNQFFPRFAVDLPALRKSLQRVQRTLTCLTIDTSESAWRVDVDQVIPALGSLREFKSLTYLDVAGLVLWGDDDTSEPPPLSELLPVSLQTLTIKTEWDDDVEDALNQLSLDCALSLPSLKRVECNWRPAPRFEAEYLMNACQSAGVDLILDVEDS